MNHLIANALKLPLQMPETIEQLEDQCSVLNKKYQEIEDSIKDEMDENEDENVRIQLIISKLEAEDYVLQRPEQIQPIDFNSIGEQTKHMLYDTYRQAIPLRQEISEKQIKPLEERVKNEVADVSRIEQENRDLKNNIVRLKGNSVEKQLEILKQFKTSNLDGQQF